MLGIGLHFRDVEIVAVIELELFIGEGGALGNLSYVGVLLAFAEGLVLRGALEYYSFEVKFGFDLGDGCQ